MVHRLPLSPRSSNSEHNFNNGFYKLLGSLGPLFSTSSSKTCLYKGIWKKTTIHVVNELNLWEGLCPWGSKDLDSSFDMFTKCEVS